MATAALTFLFAFTHGHVSHRGLAVRACALPKSLVCMSTAAPSKREVRIRSMIETKGGFMTFATVTNYAKESDHTVIVSKPILERFRSAARKDDLTPEEVVTATFMSLMGSGIDVSNTEGMIDASIFPMNYFTIGQLDHYWPDAIGNIINHIANSS